MKIDELKDLTKEPNLVHSNGMSITEIANAMGVDYKTAKAIFNKACGKLNKLFKESDSKADLEDLINLKQK